MRKVLLATTALVAMTGVTAANADISISGNYEWEYTTDDKGSKFSDDGHINIQATNTADNGMTFTAMSVITNNSAANSSNTEANYVQIDGDFGSIILGNYDDSATGAMDGALGKNSDIEGQGGLGAADTEIGLGSDADITWMSPKVSGFQLGVSKDLTDQDASTTDGKTDFALTYNIGGASVYYGNDEDSSNVGVKGSIAGFTIAVGNKTVDGSKAKANDVAVKYTLGNGITVAALSATGTDKDGNKQKASNFGASYTLAPGVKLNAETGKLDAADYTWIAVNMSF